MKKIVYLLSLSVFVAGGFLVFPKDIFAACTGVNPDLTTHLNQQIDSRISQVTPEEGLDLFIGDKIPQIRESWTWNPNSWTKKGVALDFSGVAVWNDDVSHHHYDEYKGGATLISPNHFIAASHFDFQNKTNISFIDNDGKAVFGEVINHIEIGNDITVGLINWYKDVDPSKLKYYSIMNDDVLKSLLSGVYNSDFEIPIVSINQYHQAGVNKLTTLTGGVYGIEGLIEYSQTFPKDTRKSLFYLPKIGGDSGRPNFLIINNEPVLLAVNYHPETSNNLGHYISQINTAMDSLGNLGYQVSEYNPVCFSKINRETLPPTNVHIDINSSCISDTNTAKIKLEWDKPQNIEKTDGYELEVNTGVPKFISKSKTDLIINNLKQNKYYFFDLRTVKGDKRSVNTRYIFEINPPVISEPQAIIRITNSCQSNDNNVGQLSLIDSSQEQLPTNQNSNSCQNFKSEFLSDVNNQIDSRLSNTSADSGLDIFTIEKPTYRNSKWQPNSDSWILKNNPIDISGISIWNDDYKNHDYTFYKGGAVLISPNHFITAEHFNFKDGSLVAFIGADWKTVFGNVVKSIAIPDTDINIGRIEWDNTVDISQVKYFSLVNNETLKQLLFDGNSIERVPILMINQYKEAFVRQLSRFEKNIDASLIYHDKITSGNRANFSNDLLINGDSGQPGFIIVKNKPILLFVNNSQQYSYNLGDYISQINNAMQSLGGGNYSVTEYKPNCVGGQVDNKSFIQIDENTAIYEGTISGDSPENDPTNVENQSNIRNKPAIQKANLIPINEEGSGVYTFSKVTRLPNDLSESNLNAITYGDDGFVAVGSNSKVIYGTFSDDSVHFSTDRFNDTGLNMRIAKYEGGQYKIGGLGVMYTSENGMTWGTMIKDPLFGRNITSSGKKLSDCIKKTDQEDFDASQPLAIATGNGKTVCVGEDGLIMVSSNGSPWSKVYYGASNLNAVIYAKNMFIAVGDNGVIYSSSDGKEWKEYQSPTTNNLYGIAYAVNNSNKGIVVIVGQNGTVLIGQQSASTKTTGGLGAVIAEIPDSPWRGILNTLISNVFDSMNSSSRMIFNPVSEKSVE